jgi:hypothetical protein
MQERRTRNRPAVAEFTGAVSAIASGPVNDTREGDGGSLVTGENQVS